MKSIDEIVAKKSSACNGMYGLDAEARVCDSAGEEDVFVHVNLYDGFEGYMVSKESLMDFGSDDGDGDDGSDPFDGDMPPTDLGSPDYRERLDAWLARHADGDAKGPEYIEEYEKLADAKKSAYGEVFKMLHGILKAMDKEI